MTGTMTETHAPEPLTDTTSPRHWLDTPLSSAMCLLSWLLATIVFIGVIAALGAPTEADATESNYAIWAIAHGDVSCAYPAMPTHHVGFLLTYLPVPSTAPTWPLVGGAIAALTRIGHSVAFPSTQAMGPNCDKGYELMFHWALHTSAIVPTTALGYLSWFFLLAGFVALLRAVGRGRSGWEAAGVLLLGVSPVVWFPVLDLYHPQDIVTMGLVLLALATVVRRRWAWAGVLLALAILSQQFALLVIAPLIVLAPGRARWRLVLAALATGLVVTLPLAYLTSGRVWHSILVGTGNTPSFGGTLLRQLHLHGNFLLVASRVLPIVVAACLAWWVLRRLGPDALAPVPLISLMAVCLSLRVVFEENLFGYYFLALAVMLIVLAVVCGRIRGELVAWLAMVTLAYNPVPWGGSLNQNRSWGHPLAVALPEVAIAVALVLLVWDAAHRRVRWYLAAWLVIALCAFGEWPPWADAIRGSWPPWAWQLVLLPTGIALAAWPLGAALRKARSEPQPEPELVEADRVVSTV